MDLVLNSIWKSDQVFSELEPGKYRLISLCPLKNKIALYPLLDDIKKIIKPRVIDIEPFEEGISKKLILPSSFELPGYVLKHEDQLDIETKEQRNARYKLIEPLISDDYFVFEYATQKRCKMVSNHARVVKKDVQTLYRYLRDYWRYGLTQNALLPGFPQCGGKGVEKTLSEVKVGRPISESEFGFQIKQGKNVTGQDKKKILKGYAKFYANEGELSLVKAYNKTKNEYYANEVREAVETGCSDKIPSHAQFVYWGRKLSNSGEVKKKRKPKGDFERNQRGLENTVSSSTSGPGDFYEIDATTADVHIVLELNRHYCIGRPIIYSVTDRASRMIVGFYVCLENPSWYAASLAIANAFMPKSEYCSKFGIDIKEAEWPCSYVPSALVCDRGEMKGKKPSAIIPKLGPELILLPPYRPEMKSIVERRFGILNEESLHELDGTTKGRFRKRGEIDPREKAIYTLKELTETLLRDVLKHNNFHQFDDLRTKGLIKANLEPTPLNYWNFHIQKHQHSLQMKSEGDIKALLLPEVKATVTKYGVKYGQLYYICETARKEGWLSAARTGGYWEIEARFDENTPHILWIRPEKENSFIRCTMLPKSKAFDDLTYPDILYITEWSKNKRETSKRPLAELKNHQRKKEIKENAIEEKRSHIAPISKIAKTKNIRKNRSLEKERVKRERYEDLGAENIVQFPQHKKPRNYTDESLDLIRNLWEETDGDS